MWELPKKVRLRKLKEEKSKLTLLAAEKWRRVKGEEEEEERESILLSNWVFDCWGFDWWWMRKKWELGLNEIEDGGWGGGYEVLEVLGRMNKVLSWFLVSYFLICYLLLVFVLIWCLCLIVGSLSCLFLLFVHAPSWSCGAGSLAFSCCILVLLIWIENQVISSVFACTPILYLFHTHWCLSKKNNNNNSEMFDMCLGLAQSNDDHWLSFFLWIVYFVFYFFSHIYFSIDTLYESSYLTIDIWVQDSKHCQLLALWHTQSLLSSSRCLIW